MELIIAKGERADLSQLEEIVDEMEGLEPVPAVAQRLLSLTSDPNCEMSDVVQLVASEPGLTARVLRMASSALYGGQAAQTLQAAVVRLGLAEIRRVAVTATMIKSKGAVSPFRTALWEHAIRCAATASAVARRVGATAVLDPFMCGLLQDLGTLVLSEIRGEPYHELVGTPGPAAQSAREREALGFDHADVGAMVAQRWNLLDGLVEIIQFHHDPFAADGLALPEEVHTTLRIVALANLLASGESDSAEAAALLERVGLPHEHVEDLMRNVEEQVDLLRSALEAS